MLWSLQSIVLQVYFIVLVVSGLFIVTSASRALRQLSKGQPGRSSPTPPAMLARWLMEQRDRKEVPLAIRPIIFSRIRRSLRRQLATHTEVTPVLRAQITGFPPSGNVIPSVAPTPGANAKPDHATPPPIHRANSPRIATPTHNLRLRSFVVVRRRLRHWA